MEQIRNFGDSRQTDGCAYCGTQADTRDHVPSRVFLDAPYPNNLPVVPACKSCNEGFSLDEQYVACIVECVLAGSAHPNGVQREKIKKTLRRRAKLVSRLDHSREEDLFGLTSFRVDIDRIRNVVLKLARGHVAYELNEPQFHEPSTVSIVPLPLMTPEDLERFETPPIPSVWPEVGSRAMQRAVVANEIWSFHWMIAQPERYRYLVIVDNCTVVRIVLREYLFCEIAWA